MNKLSGRYKWDETRSEMLEEMIEIMKGINNDHTFEQTQKEINENLEDMNVRLDALLG